MVSRCLILIAVALPALTMASVKETAVICERNSGALRCPNHRFISVEKAEYGRVGWDLCWNGNSNRPDGNCRRDVTENIKAKCDHKMECQVESNNGQFGDPCKYIYKLLTVTYSCKLKTKRICEDKSATLECPSHKVIRIVYASYGRKDNTECRIRGNHKYPANSPGINPATPCKLNVKDRVASRCNNMQTCQVNSTNADFTDPCKYIYKMTRVGYKCIVDPKLTQERMHVNICEHDRAEVFCPKGQRLSIVRAVYGRLSKNVCASGKNPRSLMKTDCKKKVGHIVRGECEGMQECALTASNSIFKDPCVGTYKYLALTYTCA